MTLKDYNDAAGRAEAQSLKAYDIAQAITGEDCTDPIIRDFICLHVRYAIDILREALISNGAIEE